MEKGKRYFYYLCRMLFVFLLAISALTGCKDSQLSDEEKLVYEYARKHDTISSTVELEMVLAFNVDSEEDYHLKMLEEKVDKGQYVILVGNISWKNGTKTDLFQEYHKCEGKEHSESWLDLENCTEPILKDIRKEEKATELDYYYYLCDNKKELTCEEFNKGKLGYLPIDESSLKRINKVLAE